MHVHEELPLFRFKLLVAVWLSESRLTAPTYFNTIDSGRPFEISLKIKYSPVTRVVKLQDEAATLTIPQICNSIGNKMAQKPERTLLVPLAWLQKLDHSEAVLLAYLERQSKHSSAEGRANRWISVENQQIQRDLGTTKTTLSRRLHSLAKKGKVTIRKRSSFPFRWQVKVTLRRAK